MPGRPSVDIVSLFGREITPGTAVPANRLLPTVSFNPKLKRETKQFRAQGKKYNTSSVRHKQHADGNFDGILDYNSFPYILNGLVSPIAVPSAISGSTTGKLWYYQPKSRYQDNPHTYTFEVGDETAVDRYAYGQLSSLTAALGQDDMKISGNLFARTMTPNLSPGGSANEIQTISVDATSGTYDLTITAHSLTKTALLVPYNLSPDDLQGVIESLSNISQGDVIVSAGPIVSGQNNYIVEFSGTLAGTNIAPMTASSTNLVGGTHTATIATTQAGAAAAAVTEIPERPVERGQINVYFDDDFGDIGTTLVTDAFEENIQLGEKFKPKFVHNRNYTSFKEAIEVAPSLVFSFMCEHNAQGRAFLADAVANDTMKYMRVNAVGLDLSTAQDGSVTELVQFDMAGKFTEPEPVMDALNQGVYAYRYNFVALDDPAGLGRPWEISVQNERAAL